MRRFFFPTQDASIYEEYVDRQSGLDEILEVGKSDKGSYSIRSLLQFDMTSISSSLAAGTINASANFDLTLYLARSHKLLVDQSVELYFVSSSWAEGTGYFYQEPYEEEAGVTWERRDTGSLWSASGSDFIASPSASVDVAIPVEDFTFDVTTFVDSWVSGSTPNNGFLIKFPTSDEDNTANEGRMYFFSRNTHTVFLPALTAKWDDQTYSTGSLSAVDLSNLTVYPIDMRKSYKEDEFVKIRLTARQKRPVKTFSSTFSEWSNQALPTTSYFSIVDVQSNESIIPFDDNSKISADSNGSYFTFYVENMYPLRYYKVLIKVVSGDGTEQIFDNRYQFMVAQLGN